MATVTGMTAAAMQAIRDGTVTGAIFDSANHLILTKQDGTQIDGGTLGLASVTAPGQVELATSAETQTGTDATRAVTPAGLASLPGFRAQILASNSVAETAGPGSWPYAVSMMAAVSGSGWSLNGGSGTVVTNSISVDRTTQTFYASSGGTLPAAEWMRTYHSSNGGGGWTSWVQVNGPVTLNPASFTQSTALTSYPQGQSRLYYTAGSASGWDFSALAPGEVITYKESANTFGRQTFTQHSAGSANTPEQWVRTSDNATGWSAWKKLLNDQGVWTPWTPTWSSQGSVQPSLGNAALNCRYFKLGRKVDCLFEVVFGSTTNFGSSPTTSDNWQFSLPVTAARTADTLGFVEMSNNSNNLMSLARARMYSATGFRLGIATGRVDGVIATNPNGPSGDVDSLSPWTWVTGGSLKGFFSYESAS
jgi:hypothetical protein